MGVGVGITCTYWIFSCAGSVAILAGFATKPCPTLHVCSAVSRISCNYSRRSLLFVRSGIATWRVPPFGILGSMPRLCIVPSCGPSCCSSRTGSRGVFLHSLLMCPFWPQFLHVTGSSAACLLYPVACFLRQFAVLWFV